MDNDKRGINGRNANLLPEVESNLLGLLRSMNFENQVLALNFLEGMEVPRNALTDLLALSHFSRHHWLRKQAKTLFSKNAPRGFLLALQEELNFRKFTPNRHIEWFLTVRRRHVIESPVLAQYMYNWEMINLPAYMKYGISDPASFFAPYITGEKLDLSFRGMDEVPNELQELRHIAHVDLSGNVLTRLGRIVSRLPRLESLRINGNQLTRINPTVGRMTRLEFLDASTNLLERLPAGLSKLQRLKYLNISRNELDILPNFITEMFALEELHVSYNPLSKIPERLEGLHYLKILSLDNNPKLIELPPSIGSLSNLEELNLQRTGIKVLPETIAGLSKLERLNLANNHLDDISAIFQLRNLKELNLTGATVNFKNEKLTEVEQIKLKRLTGDQ